MTQLATTIQPLVVHELMGGAQAIFRFPNGYGASVVRHYGSYGSSSGLWELGVVLWEGDEWQLNYDTEITNDVIGHLTPSEVDELLLRIRDLDAFGKEPGEPLAVSE